MAADTFASGVGNKPTRRDALKRIASMGVGIAGLSLTIPGCQTDSSGYGDSYGNYANSYGDSYSNYGNSGGYGVSGDYVASGGYGVSGDYVANSGYGVSGDYVANNGYGVSGDYVESGG